jgi:ABC-type sugar transport system permease subunit
MRRGLHRTLIPVLFLAPALTALVVFRLLPAIDAIHLSFTSWDGFSSPTWVGLANFRTLLHDSQFQSSLWHTLTIVLAVPVWVAVPYAIAWVLYMQIPGWRFFRLAFFLPVALSPAMIGLYYGLVLRPEGAFNQLLRAIGLGRITHAWLNEPSLAMPMVIAIIIWSTFGIGVLIFLAAFATLDHEQIDAARVDGANGLQIQGHVVFWAVLPVIEVWSIITMIASFTTFFPLIYALTGGGPGTSTYTVDFDLYDEAFRNGHLGLASAIGVVLLIVMTLVGSVQVWLLRRAQA